MGILSAWSATLGRASRRTFWICVWLLIYCVDDADALKPKKRRRSKRQAATAKSRTGRYRRFWYAIKYTYLAGAPPPPRPAPRRARARATRSTSAMRRARRAARALPF